MSGADQPAAGASAGDYVEIITGDGRRSTGILMPHHEFSASDIVILKLDSGYNIGVKIDARATIRIIARKVEREQVYPVVTQGPTPVVSVLSTGGTIASFVDYKTGAVHPALTAEGLVNSIPELLSYCTPRAKVIYSMVSEDMKTEHWQNIAGQIAEELNSGAKGVILPHGTDTMGYTAAILSFMLKELPGPVILVGSQRSSDRPSTDAALNMTAAARLATGSDLGEVVVLMHSGTSDSVCAVHKGTRVRKMHTSRRDAFRSINAQPLGFVKADGIELFGEYRKKTDTKAIAETNLETRVALVQFYPGMTPRSFERQTEGMKGVVIAGTGLGHVSTELHGTIAKAIEDGVIVVMASQCIYGAVNMNVYSSGRKLLKAGVIPAGDMLPETANAKLMWVMGKEQNPGEIKRQMLKNIAGELSERRETEEYPEGN
jgi:glutamyl-tRNA(Gln) amidotransferase subunit D